MTIKDITATSVSIPYAAPVGPYVGRGAGGGTLGATGLIVRIESDSGHVGWGEGTGGFETDPNAILAGSHVSDIEKAIGILEDAGIPRGPVSGVEMALWDLLGKHAELPVCRLMGGIVRTEVDFTACMGLKEPGQSAATAREYIDRWGFRFIKTKAGNDPSQDLAIAEAACKEIGGEAVFRPDANGGYPPEETMDIMQKMADLGVTYFEDPCHTEHVETLARVRSEIGTHILVNGGVALPGSIRPFLEAGCADSLMPDTPAAGAMLRVRKIADAAEPWNVPCLMHCSHDLGLKTAAITHIAASTPNFSGPNDTCYHGLVDDVLAEPFTFENGRLKVPLGAGLGVEVDESKVERYRV